LLPDETICNIIERLDLTAICRLASTCRRLSIIGEEYLVDHKIKMDTVFLEVFRSVRYQKPFETLNVHVWLEYECSNEIKVIQVIMTKELRDITIEEVSEVPFINVRMNQYKQSGNVYRTIHVKDLSIMRTIRLAGYKLDPYYYKYSINIP